MCTRQDGTIELSAVSIVCILAKRNGGFCDTCEGDEIFRKLEAPFSGVNIKFLKAVWKLVCVSAT